MLQVEWLPARLQYKGKMLQMTSENSKYMEDGGGLGSGLSNSQCKQLLAYLSNQLKLRISENQS